MTLIAELAAWSLLAFALVLLFAQLAAHGIGYWLGRRRAAQGKAQMEGVGVVVGGLLGLLAFVLALTLSFANTRFAERRAGSLAETNAIGTAWLRAEAIGDPRGVAIARLLEQYTRLRVSYVQVDNDPVAIDDLSRQTNTLQTKIWGHMSAIVRQRTDPVAVALMASLNDTFDMTAAERFAYTMRLPAPVFWLLVGMSLLGMAALGYQFGLRGQAVPVLVLLLAGTWTVLIVGILDLASPRLGAIRNSTSVYEWTLQGFQGGVPIPPLPAGN